MDATKERTTPRNAIFPWYKTDYKSSMLALFSDRKRFQVIKEDLTPARLSSVQRYLRTLCNRGEIDEATYLFMRPQAAKPARAHGLPKIHKLFDKIPKFRPIIDTTGTTHYGIGKYLSQLLQPLTINEYTIKDTFDAKARIKTIDEAHLQQGYKYVSFDVVSLFTNVPLERTLKVIERRIYDEEELATTLKRCTLRKLVRDTCKKTIFSCNDVYYEQIDGVSMGGSLGPVLANIILTEFERIVINPLLSSGVIKFYCRYVDDTLLLIKHDDIDMLLNKFHSFDSNIRFTYDTFSDEPPHFLDLNLDDNKFSIYRKRTFTGQYTHFDSFVPWKYRIAWIRSLLSRIHKICSPSKLAQELQFLKKIASWNGYPKQVVYSLIKRFDQHLYKSTDNENNNNMTDANAVVPTLWLEMPYIGMKGEQLLRGLKRKLLRCLNINVQIRTRITTTKLNMYTNTKDKVPKQNKSNIVYEFTCPKCNESYIGKTDRTLLERVREHAYKDDESAVNKHLHSCYDTTDLNSKSNKELTELVLTNTYIIDHSNNWNLLLYKEALHIRRRKPLLNNGLKASRELQLFN